MLIRLSRTIFLFVLAIAGLIIYLSLLKISEENEVNERITNFPLMSVNLLSECEITLRSLFNEAGYTLIVFYSTTCIYCKNEFDQISDINTKQLSNLTIVAVSKESLNTIFDFSINYNLMHKFDFHFVQDQEKQLFNYFNIKKVPSNFLYDTNGQLMLKTHSFPEILRTLNQQESE